MELMQVMQLLLQQRLKNENLIQVIKPWRRNKPKSFKKPAHDRTRLDK
jgi:hypothetical protein